MLKNNYNPYLCLKKGMRLVMKNKKIIVLFIALFIIILVIGFLMINYFKNKQEETGVEEYVPEEEITEDQFRQTIVSLYFVNKDTNKISPEARLVDIREVVNNPYEKLVSLLIEGPKNETLKKVIPDNTRVLKTFLENDCVTIDFSSEFLNYDKEDKDLKYNMINTIVNTLTELTEVNSVKFLIDGQINSDFAETFARIK